MAPISFFRRSDLDAFLAPRLADPDDLPRLSSGAQAVRDQLEHWGACFVDELVGATGLLPSQVEEGLWELTAAGEATADGFDNLRALIDPSRRLRTRKRRPRRSALPSGSGRWTLLRPRRTIPVDDGPVEVEETARRLLRRWGVIFRDMAVRESLTVPWRELLWVYRRLEARGEVRGGRFVSGFMGEQFALPEALESLRMVRRSPQQGETVTLSAADPLNLTGSVIPGPRVRPHPSAKLRFRDGVLVDRDASPLVERLTRQAGA